MTSAPADPELPIVALLADVFRVYRKHWKVLIPLAAVVLIPQAVSSAVDAHIETNDLDLSRAALAAVTFAGVLASNLAGEALYAGMITALVVEWRHGLKRPPLMDLARDLPIARLIAADLMIAAGTALGLILLIVPGVVFATYTISTTVVIELERRKIPDALRRSVALIRGSFWRALVIGLIVLGGTEAITVPLQFLFHEFALEAAGHLALEAVLEPIQGVGIVLVTLGLMELRGEAPPQ